jgi:hypothetical protein
MADSENNNRGEEIRRRRRKPPNAINISKAIRSSSSGSRSSTNCAVCRQDLAEVQKFDDDDNDNDVKTNNYKIMYYWKLLVRKWKQFISYIYNSTVIFVAEFISNILSQPTLQDLLCEIIVRAINAFMDQDDIGAKMDDTVRRVLYDRDKARQTSRALGKEVVPMVTGYVVYIYIYVLCRYYDVIVISLCISSVSSSSSPFSFFFLSKESHSIYIHPSRHLILIHSL